MSSRKTETQADITTNSTEGGVASSGPARDDVVVPSGTSSGSDKMEGDLNPATIILYDDWFYTDAIYPCDLAAHLANYLDADCRCEDDAALSASRQVVARFQDGGRRCESIEEAEELVTQVNSVLAAMNPRGSLRLACETEASRTRAKRPETEERAPCMLNDARWMGSEFELTHLRIVLEEYFDKGCSCPDESLVLAARRQVAEFKSGREIESLEEADELVAQVNAILGDRNQHGPLGLATQR
jgi:hypothetical protein